MDSSKIVFILISGIVFIAVPLFIRNVRHYFLALASFLYVFSSGWMIYQYNGLFLADLPILGLFILGLVSPRRFRWSALSVGFPLLGIIVWGIVSSFSATNPGWAVNEITKYARMYLLIVCLIHHIQSIKELRIVLIFLLVGLIIQSIIGIYQWRFGPTGLWFLGERRYGRIQWRTMGTFFVPSFYANYLAMVLPVAFRAFVYFKSPSGRWTTFYGSAFSLGILALFTSFGRGPWIGFTVAITILLIISMFQSKYKPRLKWTMAIVTIFVTVFLLRYGRVIMDQFGGVRQGSYEIRFPQFVLAQRIIRNNMVTGVGLGNYELVSRNYMTAGEQTDAMSYLYGMIVHNSYLLLSAEMGILGGLFLIFWFGVMLIESVKILRMKIYHPLILNLTLGIVGGIIAIMIVFTFSPDIHSYQILYQLSLFSGVLMAEKRVLRVAESRKARIDRERNRINAI